MPLGGFRLDSGEMMNEWINDELLSAYLDGEVTAEEQAKIEELLAAQPQVRQLLDELRALSVSLQSLPPARLEADLSERVIRAAQRQILTGGDVAAESTGPAGSLWTRLRKRLTGRAMFWPAVAAALALWIVLTDLGRVGDPLNHREIVHAPVPEMSAPDDSASIGAKNDSMDRHVAAGGMGSNRVPAGARIEAAAVGKPDDAALSDVAAAGAADGAMPPPKPGMIDPVASGDEGVQRKSPESERWDVASATAKPQGGAAEPGGPMAYRDSSVADASEAGLSRSEPTATNRADRRRFGTLRNAEGSAQPGGAGLPPPSVAMAPAVRPSADAPAGDGGGTLPANRGETGWYSGMGAIEPAMEAKAEEQDAAEDGILVVHVDIAADAARDDLFGQLLAQNSILWEPDPAVIGASGWNNVNPQRRPPEAAELASDSRPLANEAAAPAGRDATVLKEVERRAQHAPLIDRDALGAASPSPTKGAPARPAAPRPSAGPGELNNAPAAAGAAPGSIAGSVGGMRGGADAPPMAVVPEAKHATEGHSAAADPSPRAKAEHLARSENQSRGISSDMLIQRALKAPPSPEIELVYVEAQASQIEKLIADLAGAPQSVVSVAVEPARGSQNSADRQQMPIASQLAQGAAASSTVLQPGAQAVGGGAAKGQADKMPSLPEDAPADNAPMTPVERSLRAATDGERRLAETGPAAGTLGGGPGAAPAENELMQRSADREELERRGALRQVDRFRQDIPVAGKSPSEQGEAGGQVVFGRAHRVARLDARSQVVGQALKDQVAATRRTGGDAADAKSAQPEPAQSSPGATVERPGDGLRQAFAKREADQDANAIPETPVDSVEAAEKAKQRNDDLRRDLALAQSNAQGVLPQVARQQRVLFVLRTVPSVQAAAARPPMASPGAASAGAEAAVESSRAAPKSEADRDMLPAAPPPTEPSRQ